MRITDRLLDPVVEELIDGPQGALVAPGSDRATNMDAPAITGDAVMDTQLENLRKLICSHVWTTYTLITRFEKVRLWATESRWGEGEVHVTPPSTARKDDHPWIALLIQQAGALARVEANTCEVTVYDANGIAHTHVDNKVKLQQEALRIELMAKIQTTIEKIDRAGRTAIHEAQDLVKSFHEMAQRLRIHNDKMAGAADSSDIELMRLAAKARPVAVEPT